MYKTATKYLFFAFFILLRSLPGTAQNDGYRYYGVEYSYGGILRHSDELPAIGQKRINGLTLTIGKLHTSKNKWLQCFCYPYIGAGIAVYDHGDPDVLGQSINPFLFAAPYSNSDGKLHFIPRGGAGFSYVTKTYEEKNNPQNIFFSTKLSFFLQLHLSLRYDITPKLQWQSSLSYNHISNGGLKQPNKGMNFITVNSGFNYYIHEPDIPGYSTDPNFFKDKKRWQYGATCFYSMKVANKTNNFERENCPIYGCNLTLGYFIPKFSYLNLGIEYIADTYIRNLLNRNQIDKDFQRLAIITGHTANFGKLSFVTDLGWYIYSPYKAMDPVYQHYRLTYNFGKKWFLGVGLKAHRHVAELMMINTGITL
ncbi:acyloxyacyl hydrolase [Salinivirga cyanobacteriivorans]